MIPESDYFNNNILLCFGFSVCSICTSLLIRYEYSSACGIAFIFLNSNQGKKYYWLSFGM